MTLESNKNPDTQLHHSGNAPSDIREVPVTEFDHTSLSEAVNKGLITVPEDIGSIVPDESTETETKKPRFSTRAKVIAAASIAVVLGGGYAADKALTPSATKQPTSQGSVTHKKSPVKPVKSTTPITTNNTDTLTVKSIEIPTGLSPNLLGTAVVNAFSKWDMAGATPENQKAWFASSESPMDFQNSLAAKNAPIFEEALLAPNWEGDLGLSTYVNNEIKPGGQNASFMGLWFDTYNSTRDAEPYGISETVDGEVTITSQTADSESISIPATVHEDLDNRAVQLSNGSVTALSEEKVTIDVTLQNIDGTEKMSSLNITPRQ